MNAAYLTALLMGLTGGLHCAGMCGPIMLFMPFQAFSGVKKAIGIGLYHFSRITAYACLALILYSFRDVFSPRVQQYVSVVLGVILLMAAVVSFFPMGGKWQVRLPWSGFVRQKLTYFMSSPGMASIAVSGFLNGLLPCGLVYLALSTTLTLRSPWQAISFVYIFGLGTLPVLVSIAVFKSRLLSFKRLPITKFTPLIVFIFGCLFVLRGLNMGIPYLSPRAEISKGHIHSCCEKMKSQNSIR